MVVHAFGYVIALFQTCDDKGCTSFPRYASPPKGRAQDAAGLKFAMAGAAAAAYGQYSLLNPSRNAMAAVIICPSLSNSPSPFAYCRLALSFECPFSVLTGAAFSPVIAGRHSQRSQYPCSTSTRQRGTRHTSAASQREGPLPCTYPEARMSVGTCCMLSVVMKLPPAEQRRRSPWEHQLDWIGYAVT